MTSTLSRVPLIPDQLFFYHAPDINIIPVACSILHLLPQFLFCFHLKGAGEVIFSQLFSQTFQKTWPGLTARVIIRKIKRWEYKQGCLPVLLAIYRYYILVIVWVTKIYWAAHCTISTHTLYLPQLQDWSSSLFQVFQMTNLKYNIGRTRNLENDTKRNSQHK